MELTRVYDKAGNFLGAVTDDGRMLFIGNDKEKWYDETINMLLEATKLFSKEIDKVRNENRQTSYLSSLLLNNIEMCDIYVGDRSSWVRTFSFSNDNGIIVTTKENETFAIRKMNIEDFISLLEIAVAEGSVGAYINFLKKEEKRR